MPYYKIKLAGVTEKVRVHASNPDSAKSAGIHIYKTGVTSVEEDSVDVEDPTYSVSHEEVEEKDKKVKK